MPYSVFGIAANKLYNLSLIESAFLSNYIGNNDGVNAILALCHCVGIGIGTPTNGNEVGRTSEYEYVLSGLGLGCGSLCGGSYSCGLYGCGLSSCGLSSCGLSSCGLLSGSRSNFGQNLEAHFSLLSELSKHFLIVIRVAVSLKPRIGIYRLALCVKSQNLSIEEYFCVAIANNLKYSADNCQRSAVFFGQPDAAVVDVGEVDGKCRLNSEVVPVSNDCGTGSSACSGSKSALSAFLVVLFLKCENLGIILKLELAVYHLVCCGVNEELNGNLLGDFGLVISLSSRLKVVRV